MTNKDITKAYVGSTAITAMYLGDTKVWSGLPQPLVGDFVYSNKTWSSTLDSTKTCIGIITDVRDSEFDFLALNDSPSRLTWGSVGTLVPNITTTADQATALLDLNGKSNTQQIVTYLGTGNAPAAEYCYNYYTTGFPAGSWFLPSAGQWQKAYDNKTLIESQLTLAGGSTFASYVQYNSSTQTNSTSAWAFPWYKLDSNYSSGKNNSYPTRPFCTYSY